MFYTIKYILIAFISQKKNALNDTGFRGKKIEY